MNKLKNNFGFTLIEMLIAVSIFSLVLVAATNIYLIVNNSQRKVVTLQKIQEDVRFLFEAMAQDIRLSSINYDFYIDNNINVHPLRGGNDNSILALIDQDGTDIFYRLGGTGSEIQYCEVTETNTCSLSNADDWENITPDQVAINYLKFTIVPTADPYQEISPETCSGGNNDMCTIGYHCAVSDECLYSTGGENFHPRVTISVSSTGVGSNLAEDSKLIMQTTVSTRVFPGPVENLNYD